MHNNAAGVAIQTPHLDDFIEWFNNRTNDLDFNENCYQVNFDLKATDDYLRPLCWDVANHNKLWGGDNPQPIVHLSNIKVPATSITIMGQKKDTIKFVVGGVNCIIFRSPELAEKWSKERGNIVIDAIGRPALNEFMGNIDVQFLIDDLDWHIESLLDF